MIVDAHAHLGFDEIFDVDFTAAELLACQQQNEIAVTLVQPAAVHDLPTVQQYHDAIADLARRYPGHYYGIANPNPHLPGDDYAREIRRCINELGFRGIKIHPTAHAVNPLGRHGRRVFEIAAEMHVPVIIHTGAGIPWSAPSLLASAADSDPELPIILAHSGMMVLAGEAALLAEQHPNVYLECSWTGGFLVRAWVQAFGASRILFGSDHADNAATELTKFRTCGLNHDELAWAMGGTAAQLFGIPEVTI